MLARTLLQGMKTLFLGLCTCLSNVGSHATTESEDIVSGTVYLSVQCWLARYYLTLDSLDIAANYRYRSTLVTLNVYGNFLS
jgi:hypothetical protein